MALLNISPEIWREIIKSQILKTVDVVALSAVNKRFYNLIHSLNRCMAYLSYNISSSTDLCTHANMQSFLNVQASKWVFIKFHIKLNDRSYKTFSKCFQKKRVIKNLYIDIANCKVSTRRSLYIKNVHTLNLSDCKITDINKFKYVHVLNVFYRSFSQLDLIAFNSHIPPEYFGIFSVRNVNALGNIHSLQLINCYAICDVGMLGTVHTLNLHRCINAGGLNMLGHVHSLDLSCTDVVNVSMFGNVHTLNLNRCCNVVNVSALGNVHSLNLSYTSVTDVSALGRVHTLDLSQTSVSDVSALGNVHSLDISYCPYVKDISALGNVHSLWI